MAALMAVALVHAAAVEPLRVAHTDDYAPYEFLDAQGRPVGFLIDVFQAWSAATGRPVEWHRLSWNECLEALREGRVDCLTGMTPTAERRLEFMFARELARAESRIFTHRSLPPAQTWADLAGLVVGVVEGDQSQSALATRAPMAIAKAYRDYEALVRAGLAGEVRALVGTSSVLHHHLTRLEGLGTFAIASQALNSEPLAPAVLRGREDVLRDLEVGFGAISRDSWQNMARTWVPHSLAPEDNGRWRGLLKTALIALAGVLLVVAVVLAWNVSLRRRVAQALSAEAAIRLELSALLDAAVDVAVIGTDANGVIHQFSRGAERLLGRSAASVVGLATPVLWHDPEEIIERAHTLGVEPGFAVFVATIGAADTPGAELADWNWLRSDGGVVRVRLLVAAVRDRAGQVTGYVGVARDLSRERELEARVRHAERLDALGQMAGGIAHDFNNHLTGIAGFAELIAEDDSFPDKARSHARVILGVAERAGVLSRQMLAFARRDELELAAIDLAAVVEEVVAILRRTVDPRIRVEWQPPPRPAWVRGEHAQLESAVLNLALNARDAQPNGGRIAMDLLRIGEHWRLTITDDGPGIPPDIRGRIFEPFFTTKGPGKGTGLGLSAVWGIATSHGGRVDLDCPAGGGSVFSIVLPSSAPPTARHTAIVNTEPTSLHILLVDDDDTVRTVASSQLQASGHRVSEVASGQAALDLLTAEPKAFDLVMLDMIMPGMHGREVLPRLKALAPTVPVLICSGRAEVSAPDDLATLGAAGFLAKPYRRDDLLAAIARALRNKLT